MLSHPKGVIKVKYYRRNGVIECEQSNPDGTSYFEYACQDFLVTKKYNNVLTKDQMVVLVFRNDMGELVEVELPRSAFVGACPKELTNKNFLVDDKYAKWFFNIFQTFEHEAEWTRVHDRLGYQLVDEKMAYLCATSVGMEEPSEYRGALAVRARGSVEGWLDMMNHWIVGYQPTFFAVMAGLSAPVASLLEEQLGEVLVFCLAGGSSSGKTSALKTSATSYGRPQISKGIVDNFNDTNNYRIESLAQKEGFATFIDEATALQELDDFVYNASAGVNKGRCNSEGTLRDKKFWSGTILLTCEGSAVEKTSKKRGVYMRLLEIEENRYMRDEKQIAATKRMGNQHYGHAISYFVAHLLKITKDVLIEWHEEAKHELQRYIRFNDPYSNRLCEKFAVVLVTARIAYGAFCFDNYADDKFASYLAQKVESILVRMYQEVQNDPVEALLNYTLLHGSKFNRKKQSGETTVLDAQGTLTYFKGGKVVLDILSETFNEVMIANNLSPRIAVKDIKHRKRFYRTDVGQCQTKFTLNGIRSRGYSIVLQEKNGKIISMEEELEDDTAEVKAYFEQRKGPRVTIIKPKETKKTKNIKVLLDDTEEE